MSDRQATNRTSCLETLRAQRAIGQHMQVASCGTRFCTNSQSERSFYGGTLHLATLRGLLMLAAIHGNPVAVGDCQSAFHQSPMLCDPEPAQAEPVTECSG